MLATLTALAVPAPTDPDCRSMRRLIRTFTVALVTLAAWLVAGPAFAAAPICDDRGASAFAPAPTLDSPNASVDIGVGGDTCGFAMEDRASLHQGRAHDPLPAPAGADLLPVGVGAGVLAAPWRPVALDVAVSSGRSGVHGPLERPPR